MITDTGTDYDYAHRYAPGYWLQIYARFLISIIMLTYIDCR